MGPVKDQKVDASIRPMRKMENPRYEIWMFHSEPIGDTERNVSL